MQLKQFQLDNRVKLKFSFYLPKEGLQGENIPSHILWENIQVESIHVSFGKALKVKEVFNAETFESHDGRITVEKIEVNGYLGLSFESVKVPEINTVVARAL